MIETAVSLICLVLVILILWISYLHSILIATKRVLILMHIDGMNGFQVSKKIIEQDEELHKGENNG